MTMQQQWPGRCLVSRNRNLKPIFANCDNYSLNLVGMHAAPEQVFAIHFLEFDLLHNFFSLQLNNTVGKEGDSRDRCKAVP